MRKELAKLDHPACPPVDWVAVEHLCLALFRKNGAELHSVAAFTLARSQLHGLQGLMQGLGLIAWLVGTWPHGWPASASARVDVLGWLFAQLRSWLRGLQAGLEQIEHGLESLNSELTARLQEPCIALQALREQLGNLVRRLPSTFYCRRNDCAPVLDG